MTFRAHNILVRMAMESVMQPDISNPNKKIYIITTRYEFFIPTKRVTGVNPSEVKGGAAVQFLIGKIPFRHLALGSGGIFICATATGVRYVAVFRNHRLRSPCGRPLRCRRGRCSDNACEKDQWRMGPTLRWDG